MKKSNEQLAQWATIAHLGTSITFGDTIIYDAQAQVNWTWNSDQDYIQTLKILCQFWLSASIKKIWIKIAQKTWWNYIFHMLKGR